MDSIICPSNDKSDTNMTGDIFVCRSLESSVKTYMTDPVTKKETLINFEIITLGATTHYPNQNDPTEVVDDDEDNLVIIQKLISELPL